MTAPLPTIIKRGMTVRIPLPEMPNPNFVPRRSHQELSAPIEEQHAAYKKAEKTWKMTMHRINQMQRRWPYWITPAQGYDFEPPRFVDSFEPHYYTAYDETQEEYEARTTPDQRWGFAPVARDEGVAA